MNTEDVMKIVEESFKRRVHVYHNHDDIAYLSGRKEFLEDVKDQIDKLQKEEDAELAKIGVIKGDDAKRFVDRMMRVDEKIRKKMKCYAEEMGWNHNMCAMQSSCDGCSAHKPIEEKKDKVSEIDPYNEENWEDEKIKKKFLLYYKKKCLP